MFLQGGGVHLAGGADLQEVRRRRPSPWCATSRTGWPPTCGASASRRPTPSPPRSASPATARNGSRPGWRTPVRGGRRGTLLPARAQPDGRRGQDPRGACRDDHPVPGRARRGRGVGAEEVPALAETAPRVPAVYLPPFSMAERSLASALLRLLAARADRLAAFSEVDWDKALAWLRGRTGTPLAPEQEEAVRLALTSRVAVLTGGPGCGKSFHGAFGRGRWRGPRGPRGAGRADRPRRQAAGRTDRARSGHHPPAAAAAAGRRALVRRHHAARRRPGGGGRDLDGGPDPGQQAGQGGTAGRAPAAGRWTWTSCPRWSRRGAARPAHRGHAARGTADQDLPAGPAVRHRRQRAPDQRGPAAAERPASPTSSGSPATSRRRSRRS